MGKYAWPTTLVFGVVLGMALSSHWPARPIGAVATDRKDTFALATGFVDEGVEAVYYLDFLTGSLKAGVLSPRFPRFRATYETNVNADLQKTVAMFNANRRGVGAEMQVPATPNYIMVTGLTDVRRAAGQARPSPSALYIAETNTGLVLAYLIPWAPEMHSTDRVVRDKLGLWAAEQFSSAILRVR